MSLDAPGQNSQRFTLTDYDYDRETPTPSAGPSRSIPTLAPPVEAGDDDRKHAAPIAPPAPVRLPSASSSRKEKQGSGSTTSSSASRLRLHQPEDRPVYHPSHLTTSPTHPLSPSHPLSPTYHLPPTPTAINSVSHAGPISPTSSEIRPLPSIPRSFSSSSRSMEAGPSVRQFSPTPLSPLPSDSPPLPRIPTPRQPTEESYKLDLLSPTSLSPPPLAHRHSSQSGQSTHSGISNAWTEHDYGLPEAKEKGDINPEPTLPRGLSTTATKRWYDRYWPSSGACRALLLTVILETIIDLTIEGNILWRFQSEIDDSDSSELDFESTRRLPIFLIIYGLAHLWQFVLVVIAIKTRNTVQVNAVTAFNFAFLGYAVIQIYELRQILGGNLEDGLTDVDSDQTLLTLPLNVLTGVVIGVVATGSLILLVLAYILRKEFGWERYRFLGADLQIRKYFFRFQIFECLCYFSAFFCAGFGIQFIWLVLQKSDVEYIITWVAFPLLIMLLVLGRWAARYENVYAMGVFMVGLIVGCAYFVFKLVRIWQLEDTTYYRLSKSLTVFDVLSLASLASCFVLGIIVWRDFGKGLKEAVANQKGTQSLHSLAGRKKRSKAEEESRQGGVDLRDRRVSLD